MNWSVTKKLYTINYKLLIWKMSWMLLSLWIFWQVWNLPSRSDFERFRVYSRVGGCCTVGEGIVPWMPLCSFSWCCWWTCAVVRFWLSFILIGQKLAGAFHFRWELLLCQSKEAGARTPHRALTRRFLNRILELAHN